MHLRFRRTLHILPGVHLNVSKHGISTTVGARGAHLTFNRYGVRQAVGLPGTGLSEVGYLVGGHHSGEHSEEHGGHASPGEEEARQHVQSIHHGEGLGCVLPGIGCLGILLVVALGAVLLASGALNSLHPLTSLSHLVTPAANSVANSAVTVVHRHHP